jgi:hypothetical protein
MVHNFKKPPRLPLPDASQPVRSYVRSTSPVQPGVSTRLPGSPNSYSSAVVLGLYVKEESRGDGRNTAVMSPVKVPRPDSLVTEYRDYPMPPICMDGRGQVFQTVDRPEVDLPFDTSGRDFLNRPQTAGPRSRSPLNRTPSDQSNKYNNGIPITSNSSFARSSSRRRLKGEGSAANLDDPSNFHMNTIHYVSKNKIHTLNPLFADAAADSSGLEFVRSSNKKLEVYNDDQDFGRVRVTPAFSAGQGSTLGFAYSSRPSTEARPLTGITMDLLPADWQQFGDVQYEEDKGTSTGASGANTGRHAPTPTDKSRTQSAKARPLTSPHMHQLSATDMNKRVLELYRGVGVYTKNNLELEARQKALRILEAGIKDVTPSTAHIKGGLFNNVLPTETRKKTTPSSLLADKRSVPANLSIGSVAMTDSGSLHQVSYQNSKAASKSPSPTIIRKDNSFSKKK